MTITIMYQTIRLVAEDHHRDSPLCTVRRLRDLMMIPIENAQWVGGPPIT